METAHLGIRDGKIYPEAKHEPDAVPQQGVVDPPSSLASIFKYLQTMQEDWQPILSYVIASPKLA